MKEENEDTEITLIYDPELKRPGCVLLQAIGGCAQHNGFLSKVFPSETWLTHPTPGMQRITGTRKQWEQVATGEQFTVNSSKT